jgi:biopolymer transport protein ExbD
MALGKHAEEAMEESEIDLTPLIDCFLLLIIFFSCLEFKSLEAKLPAYLPKDVGAGKQATEPQEKLRLQIVPTAEGREVPRYPGLAPKPGEPAAVRVEGHQFNWLVGPKLCNDLDSMSAELKRIASDKSKWQEKEDPVTKEKKRKPMTVVIEPLPGVYYGDVALTVDAVLNAGFEEINFGGGLGAKKKQKQ